MTLITIICSLVRRSPDELKQPILSDARHLHFGMTIVVSQLETCEKWSWRVR
jgi:hypothetical protein